MIGKLFSFVDFLHSAQFVLILSNLKLLISRKKSQKISSKTMILCKFAVANKAGHNFE